MWSRFGRSSRRRRRASTTDENVNVTDLSSKQVKGHHIDFAHIPPLLVHVFLPHLLVITEI